MPCIINYWEFQSVGGCCVYLEPAGSRGVYALDDYALLPFVFGSAQNCPRAAAQSEAWVSQIIAASASPSPAVRETVAQVSFVNHTILFFIIAYD